MKKKIFFSVLILGLMFIGQNALAESNICPFDREMSLGSEDSAVKELQSFLALDKQVYSGPSTGYFGPATQKGVKNFQEKAGLLANGKVDLATATVLCQIYLSYKASEPINSDNTLESNSSCFISSESLELGDSSSEVSKLQKWLTDGGFYPEKKFTGYYGSLTAKAVKRFQKSQGIIQTGIVGPKTKAVICGEGASLSSTGDETDITLSGLKVDPEQIDVGTSVNILVQEKNISNNIAGKHTTSLYINEKEVSSNSVKSLNAGEDNLSINYNWKCTQKGIYVFKIFVDSDNELVEINKFNNVLVFPVNCGGVTKDLKYSCSSETSTCEIDASGSMTLSECTSSCQIGDKSLPDLVVSDFSPNAIKINETLPLVITEKNDGNSKAERHGYNIIVGFGGEEKPTPAVFNDIEAKATQEAKGNWTCTVAGVYTFTIDLDPNNDIKESNEANNKKVFKVECSDVNGNVPKDEEKKEEKKEKEKTGSGGTGLPDLVMTLDPTKMDSGKNNIKFSIKNNSTKDITSKFYFQVELLDANDKIVKSYDPMEVPGFGAGKEFSDVLFKDGANCDTNAPFKIRATIDSTKIVNEKLENNNSAESTCGAVKSPAGGASGGGNEARDKDAPPCSSGEATLEVKSATAQIAKDLASGKELTNNYIISYEIVNNNSTRAEGVKIEFWNGSNIVKSQSIANISGCNSKNPASYESSLIYTCQGEEKNINMKVKYNGNKSITKDITIGCSKEGTAIGIPYCEIDKAVNSAGEVRISTGDNIMFTLKVTGANVDPALITGWTGAVADTDKTKAYKSFNGFPVGRYSVSGVYVTVKNGTELAKISCQDITVIIGNNTTNLGKVPNFSTNTQCITNLDLNSSMTGTNNFCFTNYIQDLNSKCESIKYSWETASSLKITDKNVKTFCIDKSLVSKWPTGTSDALKSTISCDYGGQKYSQSVICKINAYTTGSGSSAGSLVASCSGSPKSVNKGTTVEFTSSVSKSGFSSGKCNMLKYFWNGSSSDYGSGGYKTSYSTTGTKTMSLRVECSDDSSKYATASCSVDITDSGSSGGGYNPVPADPIKSGTFGATCKCDSTGCNAIISGSNPDYNAYTCTWTINGVVKSLTSSCKGYSTSNPTSGSVKVVEDSTGKSVNTTCSIN